MNSITDEPGVNRFQIACFGTVFCIHLVPGASVVSRFHHHEHIISFSRFHHEVQISVGSLPGSDPPRVFHKCSAHMVWWNGQAEYRIVFGYRYGPFIVGHPELEYITFIICNSSVGKSPDNNRPFKLAVNLRSTPTGCIFSEIYPHTWSKKFG